MFNKGNIFYPIIYAENEAVTVEFFEHFFNFEQVYKDDNYVVLQNKGENKNYLGIMRPSQSMLKKEIKINSAAGSVLSIYVDNLGLAYQELTWHKVPILQEIGYASCENEFFVVQDPNGVILVVAEMKKDHPATNTIKK